jgi:hypothetical protein
MAILINGAGEGTGVDLDLENRMFRILKERT